MDFLTSPSEETLVAQPTKILTYTLTNDNPTNTSLIDLSSERPRPAYTVQTEITRSKTMTIVRNSEETTIATLQWRESLPDKVTVGDKPAISQNKWLKSGLLPLRCGCQHEHGGKKQLLIIPHQPCVVPR